ncbi:Uncharacterized protein Adt_21664 [Abeliophyllum distichum]|uniref:Reverse transcriptase n=1 Tax=Abeliophyllum distichum TaxID=126358 RepID=A0ABD1T0E2_9LAMI
MTIQTELMDNDPKKAKEDMVMEEGLDAQIISSDSLASPAKELETFTLNPSDPSQSDMVGISPSVACHALKVDPKIRPKIQKRKPLSTKRYDTLKEEVNKLLANRFIREAVYPQWVSNPVLVRKNNRKWRVCIDFSYLNQVFPKDSFLLPRID